MREKNNEINSVELNGTDVANECGSMMAKMKELCCEGHAEKAEAPGGPCCPDIADICGPAISKMMNAKRATQAEAARTRKEGENSGPKAILTYEGGLHAVGRRLSDKLCVILDAATGCGGSGASFSPLDLLAVSYGGCVIMTLDKIAHKHGFDIVDAQISVSLNMDERFVPRLAGIDATVILPHSYTEEQIEVLRKSASYCVIHATLRPEVKTTLSFETAVPPDDRRKSEGGA